MAPRLLIAVCVAAAATFTAGCGSKSIELASDDPNYEGAKIFVERCAGCHTLGVAGTQGSTFDVTNREREDGPNFDDRKETVDDVLFAIQNGGFSGATRAGARRRRPPRRCAPSRSRPPRRSPRASARGATSAARSST